MATNTEDAQNASALPTTPESKYFPEFQEKIAKQDGKVVVITGTTSGTGNVAAKTSLAKGAVTAMLNRNAEKATKSMDSFFEKHPEARERAHFVHCDLQDFESVQRAADELKGLFSESGIDVLCNNAGVMALEDKATKDGYDVQVQTNHLSHFLLTKELFPLLEKRAEEVGDARIVNHSSTARLAPSTLKAKYFQKNGGNLGGNGNNMLFGARWERYHQTKLANSVFTCELQKRFSESNSKVSSYCAHPGLSATELQVTTHKEGGMASLDMMKRAQSAEDGAMGIIKCMFEDGLVKGGIYGPRFITGLATRRWHGIFATNAAGKMLWTESEKACGEFKIGKSE